MKSICVTGMPAQRSGQTDSFWIKYLQARHQMSRQSCPGLDQHLMGLFRNEGIVTEQFLKLCIVPAKLVDRTL